MMMMIFLPLNMLCYCSLVFELLQVPATGLFTFVSCKGCGKVVCASSNSKYCFLTKHTSTLLHYINIKLLNICTVQLLAAFLAIPHLHEDRKCSHCHYIQNL